MAQLVFDMVRQGIVVTYAVSGSGVGHGVTSVSVGNVFVDERTLASSGVFLAVLDSSLDGEDVHAVDLETGDVLTALVVVRDGGGAVGSSSHTVLVVCFVLATNSQVNGSVLRTLAAEDDGQVP
jgi:hypothetical protein